MIPMRLWHLHVALVLAAFATVGGAVTASKWLAAVRSAGEARQACLIASPTPNPTDEYCARRLLAGTR